MWKILVAQVFYSKKIGYRWLFMAKWAGLRDVVRLVSLLWYYSSLNKYFFINTVGDHTDSSVVGYSGNNVRINDA